jgi:hypothetical protein
MKSIEFLTEAEANIAQKKLDKYLDMLSNDNLRVLIPMVKQALNMNEDDKPQTQYYGKIAPDARRASTPTSTPTLTAPTLSNKGSEETKLKQVISKLSAEEKKELLGLLQQEAKSRPASQPVNKDNKRSSEKQTKKDDKGPGIFKGCLLPIAGIIGLLSLIPDSDEKSKSDSSSQVVSPAPQTTVTPTDTYTWAPKTYWYHRSQTDGIDDRKTDFYSVRSNNEIDLDFPYGKTRMDMVVRYNNGKLASNDGGVYLQSKGQFHDGSGDVYGGYIRVKFDDGPVKRYRYLDPADNSTGTAFIEADQAFVSNLKKSKKIKIEIGYYQNGNQVFEFDTAGLSYAIEQEKK